MSVYVENKENILIWSLKIMKNSLNIRNNIFIFVFSKKKSSNYIKILPLKRSLIKSY